MSRRPIAYLSILLTLCLCMPNACYADSVALTTLDTYFHAPEEPQQFHWAFPYADALFTLDENQYHHNLAQASLGLAVSAFRKSVGILSQRDENVITHLTAAGFTNIQTQEYDIVPTIDTIATAIASKSISENGQSFTLVAVGISGAGYQDEWESNFSIGDADNHAGFSRAAHIVIDRIHAYLDDNHITGDLKLWISGYSRAAAVSNLTAAMAHADETLPFNAIYGYTFATPNTTKNRQDYPFIYNIVGQFDPVPSVPFHKWGYDRHGTTLYLPAREVNLDYAARVAKPMEIYRELTQRETFWVNPEANWFVHKLTEFLSDFIKNSADYAAHYQQIFIDTYNVKGSLLTKLIVCAKEIDRNSAVREALSDEKRAFWQLLSQESYDVFLERIGWRDNNWNAAQDTLSNILHEHFPQVYVSWIMAYDTADETFSNDTAYKRVALSGPVDIKIAQDDVSNVIAQIIDGKIQRTPGDHTEIPILFVGEELLITLPDTSVFFLYFTPRKDGGLRYMLKEQLAGYVTTRTISYDDIDITPGKRLNSVIFAGKQQSNLDSLLIDQDANVFKPVEDTLTQPNTALSDAMSDMRLDNSRLIDDFLTFALAGAVLSLLLLTLGARHVVKRHRRKKRLKANGK